MTYYEENVSCIVKYIDGSEKNCVYIYLCLYIFTYRESCGRFKTWIRLVKTQGGLFQYF